MIIFKNLIKVVKFSAFTKAQCTLAPYKGMKNFTLLAWLCQAAAALWFGAAGFAEQTEKTLEPFVSWNVKWSGAWEKTSSIHLNRTFHNQGEINLFILPLDLQMRGKILDRRTINFDLSNPWANPVRETTNLTGGLYHTQTSTRLLYGVLEERGLPARIRSPWIRSPPYPENHKPSIADLRTEASSTREDEVYLHISSPFLTLSPGIAIWCFGSAQTTINNDAAAYSGGLDIIFNKKSNLLLETFYAEKTLPPKNSSSWFVTAPAPPSLPEREFRLYAAAFLFKNPYFSASSDFAFSQTFFWGNDIYANLGVSFSPSRSLLISFAADGAGERFVNRDGVNYSEGFRSAGKIEWKGRFNSLLRINSTLRADSFGEEFNRFSFDFLYRAPVRRNNKNIHLTRLSLSADRSAQNPEKIINNFSGAAGFGLNPFRLIISPSVNYHSVLNGAWSYDSGAISGEIIWQHKIFQLRIKGEYMNFTEKNEKWGFYTGCSWRFRQGRLNFRLESPDLPEKWNWGISWRAEIHGKI